MIKHKSKTAGGKPKKQTIKSTGDWIEIADGVKMRTRSLDEIRVENPDINYFLPVDGQTDLNRTRLSLEQLAIVRKRFGDNCTLQNIQLWLEKKNLKIERLNWLHILELIESENLTGSDKEKTAQNIEGEWSKIMSKQEIATALGLSGVYKLNILVKTAKLYEIRQSGNRESWQIRIDKLDDSLQKKLKP